VTMTTVGFGDITPVSPIACNMAIFLSFAGQLYLTMIVALLVGKYITGNQLMTQSPTHSLPSVPEINALKPTSPEEEHKKNDPE